MVSQLVGYLLDDEKNIEMVISKGKSYGLSLRQDEDLPNLVIIDKYKWIDDDPHKQPFNYYNDMIDKISIPVWVIKDMNNNQIFIYDMSNFVNHSGKDKYEWETDDGPIKETVYFTVLPLNLYTYSDFAIDLHLNKKLYLEEVDVVINPVGTNYEESIVSPCTLKVGKIENISDNVFLINVDVEFYGI